MSHVKCSYYNKKLYKISKYPEKLSSSKNKAPKYKMIYRWQATKRQTVLNAVEEPKLKQEDATYTPIKS